MSLEAAVLGRAALSAGARLLCLRCGCVSASQGGPLLLFGLGLLSDGPARWPGGCQAPSSDASLADIVAL